jgi:hypothetical protein
MNGPSEEFRLAVVERSSNLRDAPDAEAEGVLLDVLEQIAEQINEELGNQVEDLGDDREAAFDQLGAVDAWASVISMAVGMTYAPNSPFPRNVAGWAKTVAERIRWLTDLLLTPLRAAQTTLGATGCAIGVAFPWGVSVELSW